jgi:hypothetical protein
MDHAMVAKVEMEKNIMAWTDVVTDMGISLNSNDLLMVREQLLLDLMVELDIVSDQINDYLTETKKQKSTPQ